MKRDQYTYGNSEASVILSRIMDEKYIHLSTKVGRIWSDFTDGLKDISNSNLKVKDAVLDLWFGKYKIRVINAQFPDELSRFLLNSMSTKYKKDKNEIHKQSN